MNDKLHVLYVWEKYWILIRIIIFNMKLQNLIWNYKNFKIEMMKWIRWEKLLKRYRDNLI